MNVNDPEEMKRQNEVILNGRRMIVRFTKGGRIREERIYDSADTDWETQWAIANTLYPTMVDVLNGVPTITIGRQHIGKGWVGPLPWELDLEIKFRPTFDKATRKFIEPDDPAYKEYKLNRSAPVRITDLDDQRGTIMVTMESV